MRICLPVVGRLLKCALPCFAISKNHISVDVRKTLVNRGAACACHVYANCSRSPSVAPGLVGCQGVWHYP